MRSRPTLSVLTGGRVPRMLRDAPRRRRVALLIRGPSSSLHRLAILNRSRLSGAALHAAPRPGHESTCSSLDTISPTSSDLPVVPSCRRRFACLVGQIRCTDSAVPRSSKRGASRSSRTLGAGCDGRVDARRRRASMRTAKSCGPDASTPASSWRQCYALRWRR